MIRGFCFEVTFPVIMPLYSDINEDGDIKRLRARSEAYRSYLRSVAEYLPEATKSFVLNDWYYGYTDFDRCPHDAWVESLEIVEHASGERHQIREIHIKLRLLASSHRGHIYFTYENVPIRSECKVALLSHGPQARGLVRRRDYLGRCRRSGNTKSCFARVPNGIFGAKVSLMDTGPSPRAARMTPFDCILSNAR